VSNTRAGGQPIASVWEVPIQFEHIGFVLKHNMVKEGARETHSTNPNCVCHQLHKIPYRMQYMKLSSKFIEKMSVSTHAEKEAGLMVWAV
jgi:hypothetical protein